MQSSIFVLGYPKHLRVLAAITKILHLNFKFNDHAAIPSITKTAIVFYKWNILYMQNRTGLEFTNTFAQSVRNYSGVIILSFRPEISKNVNYNSRCTAEFHCEVNLTSISYREVA